MSTRAVAGRKHASGVLSSGRQPERQVPRATYRVQLRPDFGFRAAGTLAPYLARLGISHVYNSPILQAAPGSTHGYDIVDPQRVNAELGGEIEFSEYGRILGRHRLVLRRRLGSSSRSLKATSTILAWAARPRSVGVESMRPGVTISITASTSP